MGLAPPRIPAVWSITSEVPIPGRAIVSLLTNGDTIPNTALEALKVPE